jgi:predicted GH43/DUF377 family glycosyl hydrolase
VSSDEGKHAASQAFFCRARPSQSWELLQIGNYGSPIETTEGWLVIIHGVGPMEGNEREGNVPDVVYLCGSMVNGKDLVLPYGQSDASVAIALVDLPELLAELRRPASG